MHGSRPPLLPLPPGVARPPTRSASSGASGLSHTTAATAARWLSRPQGEPSGVCTGHMKPQDSGSSLRTGGKGEQGRGRGQEARRLNSRKRGGWFTLLIRLLFDFFFLAIFCMGGRCLSETKPAS